ncbi:hypothetical protein L1987_41679 [Smallanthus sonchifolius]|uniref:Uncharacterized protein n=1 Tax=Smallanthus sonchifolius TaxID=185202 RepID=A0ACB9GUY3_9ASTR|nr:hypothetical protein L1987_41679 [Smallanthus sonchifolius]
MSPRRNSNRNNTNTSNANNNNNTNLAALLTQLVTQFTQANNNAKSTMKATDPAASSEPSKENKPRPPQYNKKRNFAVVIAAIPINQVAPLAQAQNKRPYRGNNPLCNTCNYHHFLKMPCRLCANCGKYGHTANDCRSGPPITRANRGNRTKQQVINPVVPAITNGRACFECGDPNHFRHRCPRIVNVAQGDARGRTLNINTNKDQVSTEPVNKTN